MNVLLFEHAYIYNACHVHFWVAGSCRGFVVDSNEVAPRVIGYTAASAPVGQHSMVG